MSNASHKDTPEVPEDVRAKFREALDKKKAAAHQIDSSHASSGKVIGPGSNDTTRRVFRRKSG